MRLPLLLLTGLTLGAQAPEAARLKATVERLAAFGTRHTLSDTASPTRGIGAARHWLATEAEALAKLPGSRLQPFEDRFTQEPVPRVPKAVELVNVGVVLPGTDASRKEALVIAGHYDSRATDGMDATSDAPGAVDDASGVAMAFELARVMAADRPAISIYFVAVAGEEQGLLGSAHLARRLKAEGVKVIGMVAADTVGNTTGMNGVKDSSTVRLFSEGVSGLENEAQRRLRESLGAENDGRSREFARYLKRFGEPATENLEALLMLRRDRIARGGDHSAFTREGFPGVRITETLEHYDRQHQVPRTEQGRRFGDTPDCFDADYCARATRLLMGAFRSLGLAPAAPLSVVLGGAVSPDTRIRVGLPADPRIAGLVLYRRRADQVAWQRSQRLPVQELITLPGVVVDNHMFAVATVDAEGHESIPTAPTGLE